MRLHPLTGGNTRRQFLFLLGMPLLCMHGQAQAQEQLLGFDSLYLSNTVLGLKFSTQTLAAKGKNVRMRGYMAPPLKPESNFFVLTRDPVAICPFCSSDAEWPVDIVVIYAKKTVVPINFSERIEVQGVLEVGSFIDPVTSSQPNPNIARVLEVGSFIDPVTGFVSQLRLRDAEFRKIR